MKLTGIIADQPTPKTAEAREREVMFTLTSRDYKDPMVVILEDDTDDGTR